MHSNKKFLPLYAPKLSNTLSYRDKKKSGSDSFSLEGFVLSRICYLNRGKFIHLVYLPWNLGEEAILTC